MTSAKWCTNCEYDRHTTDKFCWRCGTELVCKIKPKCICTRQLDMVDHFCPDCGRPAK